MASPRLLAISDLHVSAPENRALVEAMTPQSDGDWLIVAGDVGVLVSEIEWALRLLKERFDTVFWMPGNHDRWTHPEDPCKLRGEERYLHVVEMCRRLGVLTPEDPYPVWEGEGGPVTVVPLFLLYDYTFRTDGARTKAQAIDMAERAGVMCMDERLLHPDPHASREAWCEAMPRRVFRKRAYLRQRSGRVLRNRLPESDRCESIASAGSLA